MVEHRGLSRFIPYFVLTLGVAIIAFPVYLCFVGSTHPQHIVSNGQMPLTPGPLFFETYYKTLFIGSSGSTREPVSTMLLNSFIMACVIAVGKIAISIISAFAVVYFKFPLRMAAFWLIFITLMLPVEVRIYPTYKIAADLHLLDSFTGLTVPLIASATATLFFRQFFLTIPDELVEAAALLLGYGAAALAHEYRGALRHSLHLRLEPVSLADPDHDARRHADHRHRHQEDDRHCRRTDRVERGAGDCDARDAAAGDGGGADAALVCQRLG
jgi:ABC-type spermidine/putrescine transport system permease subunit II